MAELGFAADALVQTKKFCFRPKLAVPIRIKALG